MGAVELDSWLRKCARLRWAGAGATQPVIVDVGHKRKLDLGIEVPPMPLGPVASNEMWDTIYDRLVELVSAASVDAGVCEYAADGGADCVISWASALGKKMSRRITVRYRASCGWRRRKS